MCLGMLGEFKSSRCAKVKDAPEKLGMAWGRQGFAYASYLGSLST